MGTEIISIHWNYHISETSFIALLVLNSYHAEVDNILVCIAVKIVHEVSILQTYNSTIVVERYNVILIDWTTDNQSENLFDDKMKSILSPCRLMLLIVVTAVKCFILLNNTITRFSILISV